MRRTALGVAFMLVASPTIAGQRLTLPTAGPNNTGDCDGNAEVTVDELIKGVNIALGDLALTECPSLDANGDGEVTIDEMLRSVNNALNGLPTPTATATTPPLPSSTPTPPSSTPTIPLTPTPTQTSSATPSPTPTLLHSPSTTPTESLTVTPTLLATVTPTPTASATATEESSPTPSATLSPTASHTPSATATPTGTVTPTATASPTPTVRTRYCDSLANALPIPDNNPGGISNTITLTDNTRISDLNLKLDITHTWVGDLRVSLQHIETGTTVTVLDRPGIPALDLGCDRSDIAATLDDQALRAAQNECEPGTPTIGGRLRPSSPLGAFSGESLGGAWRLAVSDNEPNDTGSLVSWCLEINAAPSPPPTANDFTCNGGPSCTISFNAPFTLGFSFMDPDGNASAWRITRERSDGMRTPLAKGVIAPPAANGAVPLSFVGFSCPQNNCPTVEYDLFLVVSDSTGAESAPLSAHVVVLGSS